MPVEMPSDEQLAAMTPRDLLQLGVDLHNDGRFFEAHEAWEAVWMGAPGPLRPFYQGLIQVAAACVHLVRNEYPGTHRLLREGTTKLDVYRPDFLGITLDSFVEQANAVRERVLELGERRFPEIDRSLVPRVDQLDAGGARTLGTEGRALRYYEWPGRRGTIVLLHAPGHLARLWLPVAARLSPAWRVLAPDLPGHGESDLRPAGREPTLDALSAWAAGVAPDLRAVAGVGPAGGALATALAIACGVRAIVFAPGQATGPPDAPGARGRRAVWGNHWEMFDAFSSRTPFTAWRADLLWWYVEYGSRELADGRLELRCSGETEAALLEGSAPDADYAGIAESPLLHPPRAAERLGEVLDRDL